MGGWCGSAGGGGLWPGLAAECPQWQHIALAQGVQVVGPGLQHGAALLHKFGAVVGAAVQVFHAVGQLGLDGGPVKAQAFVQDGAGRGPKAVAGDVFFGAIAHAPQGGVDGVLAQAVNGSGLFPAQPDAAAMGAVQTEGGARSAAWRLRPVPPQRMRQDSLARVLSRSGGAYRASAARMALISAW